MSGKRPSLAESMRAVAVAPVAPPEAAPVESRPRPFFAATRAGKRKVTATLSVAAHRQLKIMAVEQGGTVEQLLTDAINDLFEKHKKPPIA
jgi:hypothetical protein